jgi:hypothetical protein
MSDTAIDSHLKSLPMLFGALGVAVACGVLAVAVLLHRGERPKGDPIAHQATIVVFERDRCRLCDDFRTDIGKAYQQSDVAGDVSLKYYDLSDGQPPKRYTFKKSLDVMPTAVVFDIWGREYGRVVGVPETAEPLVSIARSAARRAERDLQRIGAN